jgi:hypothetical protein
LRAGDEVIFSAQLHIPSEKRVENGTAGTVVDTGRHKDRVTLETHEREPREVAVDTNKFSDLSLAYAVHVYKGQGITSEASGILSGGWQTAREHAYVALSRAREQTQVYVAREDLGEQGMDVGAIERLAERLRRSGTQEASIAREADEKAVEARIERDIDRDQDLGRGIGDRVATSPRLNANRDVLRRRHARIGAADTPPHSWPELQDETVWRDQLPVRWIVVGFLLCRHNIKSRTV